MPSAIAAYKRFAYSGVSIDPVAVKKFGISLEGVTCYCPEARLQLGAKNLDPRYDKHPAMIARCASSEESRGQLSSPTSKTWQSPSVPAATIRRVSRPMTARMVVDLRDLREIFVTLSRTALAEGGTHVGELYRAVAAAEMGVISGCHSVEISGLKPVRGAK